jgi:hypothetical protein
MLRGRDSDKKKKKKKKISGNETKYRDKHHRKLINLPSFHSTSKAATSDNQLITPLRQHHDWASGWSANNNIGGTSSHSSSSSSSKSPFLKLGASSSSSHKSKGATNSNAKTSLQEMSQSSSSSGMVQEDVLSGVGGVVEEEESILLGEDVSFEGDVLCSSVAIEFVSWLQKCPLVARGEFSVYVIYIYIHRGKNSFVVIYICIFSMCVFTACF